MKELVLALLFLLSLCCFLFGIGGLIDNRGVYRYTRCSTVACVVLLILGTALGAAFIHVCKH